MPAGIRDPRFRGSRVPSGTRSTRGVIGDVAIATLAFVSTNLDDIVLLVAFFGDPRMRPRSVVLGQFIGFTLLVIASAAAARLALAAPRVLIALMGLVPLGLGVRELAALRRGGGDDPEEIRQRERSTEGRVHSQMLAVAAVTVANGGDNLGVYIPLFASRPASLPVISLVFLLMTGLLCYLGHWLVRHPVMGAPIRRHGQFALPWVLIGLGIYILIEGWPR